MYIRITMVNFHRTQRLWGEVHRDHLQPQSYCRSALDAPSVYHATSKIMSPTATCHSLMYHPGFPHHPSAMIARLLRRSSHHHLRIFDHILSRLARINSVCSDDTHVHRHGSQNTKRNWISCRKSSHPLSKPVWRRCTRYHAVCLLTPLRLFLT